MEPRSSLDSRQWLLGNSTRTVKGRSFDGTELSSLALVGPLWFDRCSFIGTDLRHATLDRCSFKLCTFEGASFRGGSLRYTRFGGCNLQKVDFRDCDLTGAEFGRVNTGMADLGRTDVTGARWDRAIRRKIVWDASVLGIPDDLS